MLTPCVWATQTHSSWRLLFKRRDKKSTGGSLPMDVPALRGSGSVGSRSPGHLPTPHHPPPRADDTYVGVALGTAARAGGGTRRRHRPKRRDPPAPHYTDDDYLMMGPMHLDEDTSSGSQAGSLKRRTPAGRRGLPVDDGSYMPMEPARPLGSPLASPAGGGGDYLNMDLSARRPPPATAAPAGDYVNMEMSGGVPGPAAPPAADTSDYLAMTPGSLTAPPVSPAPTPTAASSDYLEMTVGGRPESVAPVQRSHSARSSAERETERWSGSSRRDPETYCAMQVPQRPVSALLSVQTTSSADPTWRRSDTAPLDDRRRSAGSGPGPSSGSGSGTKVQRKNSLTGAGLLRKLDAMNPRTMFRTLSQRGKKDKRLSPSAVEGGGLPGGIDRSPSNQSLSSSNSIQEEVEIVAGGGEPLEAATVPVFRAAEPAPEPRLGSASPSGSAASVTPRASLAGSQATTPRQTPAPTPTPTPITTSNSLTNFLPAAAAAAAAAAPPVVRQRHESNPPPNSQSWAQRPQTGCGSQSLTALPTDEIEVVYASLDLIDGHPDNRQAVLAAANKVTYAKVDFNKSEPPKKQRDS